MDIEDQVCSLELAKRLKELGVRQNSVWYWYDGVLTIKTHGNNLLAGTDFYPIRSLGDGELVSAFTVAELGNMLAEVKREWNPHDRVKFPAYYIGQSGTENGWDVVSPWKTAVASEKEADSRAKLLEFWIENIKLTGIVVSWLNP